MVTGAIFTAEIVRVHSVRYYELAVRSAVLQYELDAIFTSEGSACACGAGLRNDVTERDVYNTKWSW